MSNFVDWLNKRLNDFNEAIRSQEKRIEMLEKEIDLIHLALGGEKKDHYCSDRLSGIVCRSEKGTDKFVLKHTRGSEDLVCVCKVCPFCGESCDE